MKQKRSLARKLLYIALCLIVGVGFGFLIGYFAGEVMLSNASGGEILLIIVPLIALLWLAVLLQLIIHADGLPMSHCSW